MMVWIAMKPSLGSALHLITAGWNVTIDITAAVEFPAVADHGQRAGEPIGHEQTRWLEWRQPLSRHWQARISLFEKVSVL